MIDVLSRINAHHQASKMHTYTDRGLVFLCWPGWWYASVNGFGLGISHLVYRVEIQDDKKPFPDPRGASGNFHRSQGRECDSLTDRNVSRSHAMLITGLRTHD